MLKNKIFLRKTKRGNVLKIVREHYLRDDIWCGSKLCNICHMSDFERQLSKSLDKGTNMAFSIRPTQNSHFKFNHYLILDTNVILNQIDILEENILNDIIILQTVLDEVKHKSSVVYKRLKELLNNKNRSFYVFVNENHRNTYVERSPGETSNDRNDRAIRVALKWYTEHIPSIQIILITDDTINQDKAKDMGLVSCTVRFYIESLDKKHSILLDKLKYKDYSLESNKNALYPAHWTPTQIHDGIKSGIILQGSFLSSRENYLEGSVNVEGYDKFILIQGRDGLNRAVDADIVAVKLLPKNEWKAPSEIVLYDVLEDPGDVPEEELMMQNNTIGTTTVNTPNSKQNNTAHGGSQKEHLPTGMIVGIIRRKWRQYCGILQPNPIAGQIRHIFIPTERKIPKIRIETRQSQQLQSQRIIVAIDQWPRHSRYPQGHFVRALGPVGDKHTENEVLLLEHDVPHSAFSEEVTSCLPKLPWIITAEEYANRVDLRNLNICSVDPPGCTDIDDALHCRLLQNGNYEVGVHIADVSYFIRPGTALDIEAALRATTVYLVDKRIDMVPELLSSNLCSLRGKVERFAFSCVWELDSDANIVNVLFHKSVIESKRAMTYEEAQLLIDDVQQTSELAASLRNLNRLAKCLKKRRMLNGALVLSSPEIRFNIDDETNEPIDVQAKKILETNSMVEEFMLLANVSVAEKIYAEFPECAMLRRHPEPPQVNFEPLIKAGENQGFHIDTTSGAKLANSLDACIKHDNVYFNTMLRILATRCMMQAVYFISGTLQQTEYFHYGLAAPIYTHFTSPIRRYADIIVHRLLATCIGADHTYPDLLDKRKTSTLCNNLNYRNRMAQYAGRASVALNTHLFFRGRTQEEEGYVLFVRKNALQILIPKFGLEGTIYLNQKKTIATTSHIQFVYNEQEHTQQYKNIVFHSFDPVTVRLSLDSSNVQHEKLVLALVKPYIKGFSAEPMNDSNNKDNLSLSIADSYKDNADDERDCSKMPVFKRKSIENLKTSTITTKKQKSLK